MNFPEDLYGKSLKDLAPVSNGEWYTVYEDWLPQDSVITNASGNPIPNGTVDHYQSGSRHWFAALAALGEVGALNSRPGQLLGVNVNIHNLGAHGTNYDVSSPDITPSWYNAAVATFKIPLPRFGVEAMAVATAFLGFKMVSNWHDDGVGVPPEIPGSQVSSDWNQDLDMRNLTYYHASQARLFGQAATVEGQPITVGDLLDGNEIYLRDKTEVSYDGGASFEALRGFERKVRRLPFVYQIVNEPMHRVATFAIKPYGASDATGSVIARYGSVSIPIEIPNDTVVLRIDALP